MSTLKNEDTKPLKRTKAHSSSSSHTGDNNNNDDDDDDDDGAFIE
jgi:hypothetical protein